MIDELFRYDVDGCTYYLIDDPGGDRAASIVDTTEMEVSHISFPFDEELAEHGRLTAYCSMCGQEREGEGKDMRIVPCKHMKVAFAHWKEHCGD